MSDYENSGDDETGDEGFKILIATDCHLGYMEKCSIRGLKITFFSFYASFNVR